MHTNWLCADDSARLGCELPEACECACHESAAPVVVTLPEDEREGASGGDAGVGNEPGTGAA